jgi:phosphate transport system substrate-binding protein
MDEQIKIGQYVLEREIGSGGMAQVWEARHIRLGTSVAVKFLLPRLAGDPELEDRFLREGMNQSRLRHPNIVSAIDFVQQDGRSYLIMEYVDGESLETRLANQKGPLSIDEAHAISWDVLSALDHAHKNDLVHRDVKPSNILLDSSGRAMITDFGIALAMTGGPRLTRTGSAVGTALYMSPEQILKPREIDARTDIYSFGCVLYAMLSGHPPFGGEGETDFYIKDCHVRSAPPSLRYWNPSLSVAVEQVVLKCLEKDPNHRYPNCRAVKEALDAAIAGTEAPEPPPPAPQPEPKPRQKTLIETPALPKAPTPVPVKPAVSDAPLPPAPRKHRWIFFAVLILLLAGLAAGGWYFITTPSETVLRLEGSTTVGDELAPKMLVAFLNSEGAKDVVELPASDPKKEHHGVRATLPGQWRPVLFSVIANGSGNAFSALADGRADGGMSSRGVHDDEVKKLQKLGDMRSAVCENIVALDGIAVIISATNPVRGLTRQQIGDIFRGRVTDWSAVGGNPGPINLYGRDEKSGTFDTFAALVLGGDKKAFSPKVKIQDNGDKIADAVTSDSNGIGYVGLAQSQKRTVKALQVSDGPGTASLLPSTFSVATEDYILSRRLYVYTPASTSEWMRKFVNFALSQEGQKVVKQVGFVEQTPYFEEVPIPADAPKAYSERVRGLRRASVNFRFASNGTDLDNKAVADIQRVVNALQQNGIRRDVQILGFADSLQPAPGAPSNLQLSERRAQAVADRLGAYNIGVKVVGFSSEMPVGDNRTPDGRQKNRRVEVWVR